MNFNTGYNMDNDKLSAESGLVCPDESQTIQSARDEVDINTIVRRFGLTGELPSDLRMPVSGDFTGITDFHTAMNLVRSAQEQFQTVPPDIRERFQNDPGRFMEFFENPENYDEALKLGLVNQRVTTEPGSNPGGLTSEPPPAS